jgi:hypothetical protein
MRGLYDLKQMLILSKKTYQLLWYWWLPLGLLRVFKHHDAVLNQRNLKIVAVLRAVDTEHNFGKKKQIAIEMTDRWQHFVAVISNQNRYWCQ